jgi:hypothetical protein
MFFLFSSKLFSSTKLNPGALLLHQTPPNNPDGSSLKIQYAPFHFSSIKTQCLYHANRERKKKKGRAPEAEQPPPPLFFTQEMNAPFCVSFGSLQLAERERERESEWRQNGD